MQARHSVPLMTIRWARQVLGNSQVRLDHRLRLEVKTFKRGQVMCDGDDIMRGASSVQVHRSETTRNCVDDIIAAFTCLRN